MLSVVFYCFLCLVALWPAEKIYIYFGPNLNLEKRRRHHSSWNRLTKPSQPSKKAQKPDFQSTNRIFKNSNFSKFQKFKVPKFQKLWTVSKILKCKLLRSPFRNVIHKNPKRAPGIDLNRKMKMSIFVIFLYVGGIVLQRVLARIDGSADNRFQDASVSAPGSDEANVRATPVYIFNPRICAASHERLSQHLIGRAGHRSTLPHDLERSDAWWAIFRRPNTLTKTARGTRDILACSRLRPPRAHHPVHKMKILSGDCLWDLCYQSPKFEWRRAGTWSRRSPRAQPPKRPSGDRPSPKTPSNEAGAIHR